MAVGDMQTFGDFLGSNPHGHVSITDGCFPERGLFKVGPAVKLKSLEISTFPTCATSLDSEKFSGALTI
jgi:hypothetical protein